MKKLQPKVVSETKDEKIGRPEDTPSSRVARTTVRQSVNGTKAKAPAKTKL